MNKPTEPLTAEQALHQLTQIELVPGIWRKTCPRFVEALGGPDELLRRSEMTCVGPMPRLTAEEWEMASREFQDNRGS
ncbi:hypothetical protein [Pseudomonas sp. DNDY-54]|uniref:hypothetical protein n=1 Tax=Pseudomonas sp. DNDY-54 TaxID=2870860 RepID=UPI001CA3B370|nr:hypothetical protein [Pseudomonas sp. DNDY-54]